MPEPHPLIATLAARRKQRGLTQDTVAQRLGYGGYTSVNRWEAGTQPPTLRALEGYAALLGLRLRLEPAPAERDTAHWRQRAIDAEAQLSDVLADLHLMLGFIFHGHPDRCESVLATRRDHLTGLGIQPGNHILSCRGEQRRPLDSEETTDA